MLQELQPRLTQEFQHIAGSQGTNNLPELNDSGLPTIEPGTILTAGVVILFAYHGLMAARRDLQEKSNKLYELRGKLAGAVESKADQLSPALQREESRLHSDRREQKAAIILSAATTIWSLKQQLDLVIPGNSPNDFVWTIALLGIAAGLYSSYNLFWTQREITLFDRAKKEMGSENKSNRF